MLIPVKNVLDKDLVKTFRDALDKATWQDGKLTAGSQAIHVKANKQIKDQSELSIKLGNKVVQQLSQNPVFMSAALPKKIFPPQFNRYAKAEYYGLHVDSAVMYLPDNQAMRTDISATLFLSEPNEYEGGELAIETDFGEQIAKLDAGDMILYPSTSLHEVRAVTKGARVCCFFWMESMVRDSQKRKMLFDLDSSIQTLTSERGADDHEVKKLSYLYHNLIRTWADS